MSHVRREDFVSHGHLGEERRRGEERGEERGRRGGGKGGEGEGEGEGEGRGKGGKRRGGMYEVLSTHDEAWSYSGGSTPQVW